VGKIDTSIQKAIELSRQAREADESETDEGTKPRIPAIFKTARADRQVMEESRLVSEVEDRSATAAYKIARTRVMQRMRTNKWQSLLVTSTGAGEGKTLTASNLALSIAWDVNQSVLLVDLDLQRSKVATYFGLDVDSEIGISEFLSGQAEIEDVVYSLPGLPRVSVIPNFGTVTNSSELLLGPRMQDLLKWTREVSDHTVVIFDMPPVLVDDDVLAFSPEVDAVLLVVAQGKTDRAALERVMHLLSEKDILGVVLNQCDDKSSSEYAYGYY
jgi:capsular exopolysaccharide synthesis family protein